MTAIARRPAPDSIGAAAGHVNEKRPIVLDLLRKLIRSRDADRSLHSAVRVIVMP